LRSIEIVRSGAADAAAIDSNVLRTQKLDDESRVANALLTLHERHSLAPFGFQRFVAADHALYDRDA
jgi:hypothetical protein